MEIINLRQLEVGVRIKGLVLSKNMREVETKRGTTGLVGTFEYKGVEVNFVYWDYAKWSDLKTTFDAQGFGIYEITATIETYNDAISIKCSNMSLAQAKRIDFEVSLNVDEIVDELFTTLKGELTSEGREIVSQVFSDGDLLTKFTEGYAASKHHDSIHGGLVNHTNKMINLGVAVVKNNKLEPYKDLLLLGILFHDIGKVYEIVDGAYTESPLNHRYHGLAVMEKSKEFIVEKKSKEFYEHLVAIILGHHDGIGGGERAETVWAKVVHLIDMLDSQTTSLIEQIDKLPDPTISNFYYVDRYYKF